MKRFQINPAYFIGFCALLGVEVAISLFVRDQVIRPYLGDVLVVVLLYCLIRAICRDAPRLLPLWVFLFAALVELCQLFYIVERLHLGQYKVLSTILGSTFDVVDLLCYATGAALLFLWQSIEPRRNITLPLALSIGTLLVITIITTYQHFLPRDASAYIDNGDRLSLSGSASYDPNRELLNEISMEEAVAEHISSAHIPTVIPTGYEIESIERTWDDGDEDYKGYNTITVYYSNSDSKQYLHLTFCNYGIEFPADYGKNNSFGLTTYNAGDHTQYLWASEVSDESLAAAHALWGEGNIGYGISGTITMAEIKSLIDSMYGN